MSPHLRAISRPPVAKLPDPPASLYGIDPQWHVLPRGAILWRLYSRSGRYPSRWNTFRRFGPTSSRFDHHLPPPKLQTRGIYYGALHLPTCFAEAFQATRVIDRALDDPWLVGLELGRDLQLLDLTGTWPTRAGASMAINTGPRPRARLWSQVIYSDYPTADGLWYASSMDANRPAVALYERARPGLPAQPGFHHALSDEAMTPLIQDIASRFGYAVI